MMPMRMQAAFLDPVHDAQQSFRRLLKAMSEPSTIVTLPQVEASLPLAPATVAVLLTLVDQETRVYVDLPTPERETMAAYLHFHCGAQLCSQAQEAAFAVLTQADKASLSEFSLGTEEYPNLSTTVILQTRFQGTSYLLRGAGIPDEAYIQVDLPLAVLQQRNHLCQYFPRGLDLILVDQCRVMALPRTTEVRELSQWEAQACTLL